MMQTKTDKASKLAVDTSAAVRGGGGGGGGGSGGAILVVAALHERGGAVFAAIGRMADASGPFRLLDTRRFSAVERAALRGFLKDAGVDLVLRVAPAGESLARTAALPDNLPDGSSLAEALALIAESELPTQLPWYRRTGGRFHSRAGSTGNGRAGGGSGGGGGGSGGASRAGLLIGWHRRDQPQVDGLDATLDGFKQLWTTESVALAGLLPLVPVDSAADTRWVAFVDGGAGVLALVAAAGEKTSARVLRLPADEARRGESVGASIGETLASLTGAEQAAPQTPGGRAFVFSPASDSLTIAGQARDLTWLESFAIPAAIVEAFADPDPAVRSLFNLHAIEPRRRLGLLQGALTWLSSPTRAAVVIAACIAALLFVPLGVAYARHDALRKRVAAVTGLDERLAAEEERIAFYALLRERRWPMTKLMADIATSTPEGITLEVLELNQGEAITLRGTAKSNELVTTFRENLAKIRVFDGIATPSVGSSAEGVQFQLQARVSQAGAIYRGNPIDDFAKNPLGKRLYGELFTAPVHDDADEPEPESPLPSDGRASDSARPYPGAPAAPRTGRPAAEPAASASAAPAPLTDDQISGMERGPLVIEWVKRKNASKRAADPSEKARLLAEVEKLMKRKEEIDRRGAAK